MRSLLILAFGEILQDWGTKRSFPLLIFSSSSINNETWLTYKQTFFLRKIDCILATFVYINIFYYVSKPTDNIPKHKFSRIIFWVCSAISIYIVY